MRVVEADDFEPFRAGHADAVDMIPGVDQETRRRIVGDIASPNSLDDLAATAQQQAAALVWCGLAGVSDDRRGRVGVQVYDFRCQRASTIIAMPMPPPMQSDATPRRSCRARSA